MKFEPEGPRAAAMKEKGIAEYIEDWAKPMGTVESFSQIEDPNKFKVVVKVSEEFAEWQRRMDRDPVMLVLGGGNFCVSPPPLRGLTQFHFGAPRAVDVDPPQDPEPSKAFEVPDAKKKKTRSREG